jgi:hypothetical protein
MTTPLPSVDHRRRGRIALLAGVIVAAALVLGWLESGTAIILYNDSPEPVGGIVVHLGDRVWVAGDLSPGESRRWRPPASAGGLLTVTAAGWDELRPALLGVDPRRTRRVVVRLGAFQTITTNTEAGWWEKLSRW